MRGIPPERVGMELVKMLDMPSRGAAMRLMLDTGMLKEALPEVARLQGMPHGKHHQEGDPLEHTFRVLEALPDKVSPSLAFAALMHDTGKFDTLTPKPDGGYSFHGHEDFSSVHAEVVYRRLALGMQELDGVQANLNDVKFLVENHMRVRNLPGMRKGKQKELFRNPLFPDLLILLEADDKGKLPFDDTHTAVKAMYAEFLATPDVTPKSRGIDGRRVMEVLGLKPGPKVGEILAFFDEVLADHPDSTEEDLFFLALMRMKQP